MPNAHGRSIDNTHLSIDVAERRGFIHRDYIAHCLRWTHVAKFLGNKWKDAVIWDVGCGKDLPLAKLLYSSRMITKNYIGFEYNKKVDLEAFHTGKFPIQAFTGVDFAKDVMLNVGDASCQGSVIEYPTCVVSFEVLEHVEPEHCRRMLEKMFEAAGPRDADVFISTPNYDPHVGAAGNHVNEMTRQALGSLIEDLGFQILGNWGTFASMKDYKSELLPEHQGFFDDARGYYDVNYLATLLAPFYPQYSRNNLWHLKVNKLGSKYARRFRPLSAIQDEVWGQSDTVKDLMG